MFPALLLMLPALLYADDSDTQLRIHVDTPRVSIVPRTPGRSLVALPDLEYRFVLQPSCRAGSRPAVMSLSAADSRLRLPVAVDAGDPAVVETVLRIPAAQLAPVPVSGFCELPDDDAVTPGPGAGYPADTLTIDAALSLQASLLCTGPDNEHRVWVGQALAVTLQCDRTESAAQPPVP